MHVMQTVMHLGVDGSDLLSSTSLFWQDDMNSFTARRVQPCIPEGCKLSGYLVRDTRGEASLEPVRFQGPYQSFMMVLRYSCGW